jgi:hypothetical protein
MFNLDINSYFGGFVNILGDQTSINYYLIKFIFKIFKIEKSISCLVILFLIFFIKFMNFDAYFKINF